MKKHEQGSMFWSPSFRVWRQNAEPWHVVSAWGGKLLEGQQWPIDNQTRLSGRITCKSCGIRMEPVRWSVEGHHDRPSPLVRIRSGRRHGSAPHAGTRITIEYPLDYPSRPVRGCGIPHFSSLVLGRGGTWHAPNWSLVRACMRSAGETRFSV